MRSSFGARIAASFLTLTTALAAPASLHAQSSGFGFSWQNPLTACDGACRGYVFGGRQTITSPGMAFGFADVTQGNYGFVVPTPIWNFDWEESGIVGGAVSRELATVSFGGTDFLAFEAEAGAAKRFGDQTEAEVWAALYVRWTWFPWNEIVKTSFAVSTGLNYASGISPYELRVSGNNEGSNLMHYFAPELTFALPDHPEREFVFRMHHRSGIQDDDGLPGFALFNYADTGATYATFGFRYHF